MLSSYYLVPAFVAIPAYPAFGNNHLPSGAAQQPAQAPFNASSQSAAGGMHDHAPAHGLQHEMRDRSSAPVRAPTEAGPPAARVDLDPRTPGMPAAQSLPQAPAHSHAAAESSTTPAITAAHAAHLKALIATKLLLAADQGHDGIVTELARAGADVNYSCDIGASALMAAAAKGHIAVINALLEQNANINATDGEGWTATMYAVASGNADAVRALMRPANHVDTSNSTQMNALLMAANSGHLDIVCILLQAGARANALNADNRSAAMLAAAGGHMQMLEALKLARADIDMDLLWAIEIGSTKTVENLVRAGATLNAKTSDGKTAVELAADRGRTDVLAILQAAQGGAAAPGMLGTIVEESDTAIHSDQEKNFDAAVAAWSGECLPVSCSPEPDSQPLMAGALLPMQGMSSIGQHGGGLHHMS